MFVALGNLLCVDNSARRHPTPRVPNLPAPGSAASARYEPYFRPVLSHVQVPASSRPATVSGGSGAKRSTLAVLAGVPALSVRQAGPGMHGTAFNTRLLHAQPKE